MVTIDEALMFYNQIEGLGKTETVSLPDALGRVLAVPIFSKLDHPPFDKSAMDGYAVCSSDQAREWEIVETIGAGQEPKKTVEPGFCSKIMTGAMLPHGADSVVMVEHTKADGATVRLETGKVERGKNVCLRGEDSRCGDYLFGPGCRITPQLQGALAACGHDQVEVFVRPRLAILPTGNEIITPGKALLPGQIYNSNGYSLWGQYRSLGLDTDLMDGASDDLESLKKRIREGLDHHDVLVVSGGVSMGDYDFVPQAIRELGGTVHYAKVAIKPGKPTLFATLDGRLIFGLPGNPVSTFIVTEILVRPALNRLMNLDEAPVEVKGILNSPVRRKKTERTEFRPVNIGFDRVDPIEYHGSAHLLALPRANGLIHLDTGVSELGAGSAVRVRLI